MFSIAGLRLGYAISSPKRLQQWQEWRDPWPVNGLAATLGATLMEEEDILNKQKILLIFNISLFIFQLSSFYFLKEYNDIKPALLTASTLGAIHYMLLNIYMKKELIKLS